MPTPTLRTPRLGIPTQERSEYPFPSASAEDLTTALLVDRSDHDGDKDQEEEDESAEELLAGLKEEYAQRLTPLDETLEKIGVGRYQKSLLVLCGFGWMADNMWLQGVAVILPRVQEHYTVSDRWIGLLSASIFAGMMCGAWGWGSYSDAQGRIPAFNYTLLLTSVFGVAAAFAPSFFWLCLALFGLGTGVGGSMPTDGTLFLENIPKSSHYLLTALSAFFSVGAVLTSLLGYFIIPSYSCPEPPIEGHVCDLQLENQGWRYMLGTLAVVSIAMCLFRLVFFRLHESAKYLVAAGRASEAVIALQRISRSNGMPMTWTLSDVQDGGPTSSLPPPTNVRMTVSRQTSRMGFAVAREGEDRVEYGSEAEGSAMPGVRTASLDSSRSNSRTPSAERLDFALLEGLEEAAGEQGFEARKSPRSPTSSGMPPRPGLVRRSTSARGRRRREMGRMWIERLPTGWVGTVEEYLERLDGLFEPKWRKTTRLVWMIWFFASAGYTIFNVFLPKYLETKVGQEPNGGGLKESLRDYVIYTMSGLPGSFMGAYLIETWWGRRGTMAVATIATTLATFVFVLVTSQAGVVLSSMVCSLAATLMYAVIYSYTPEVFSPSIRGTASGIASALSRLAGIIAPVVTGLMLSIHVSLPLFVSAACFAVTATAMIMLPIETRGRPKVAAMGH